MERVLESREAGLTLKQQAILFRESHHSGPLEVELTRRNIAFIKFGGLKFLEAAHIKDLLAVLRFCREPPGSGLRVSADAAGPGRRRWLGGARARLHQTGQTRSGPSHTRRDHIGPASSGTAFVK